MIGNQKKYRTNDKTASNKRKGANLELNAASHDGTTQKEKLTAAADSFRPAEISNPLTSNNFSNLNQHSFK